MSRFFILIFMSLVLSACSKQDQPSAEEAVSNKQAETIPAAETAADAPEAGQNIASLYQEYFSELLDLNPIYGTYIGKKEYNDKMPLMLSDAYINETRAFHRKWVETLEAVNRDELAGQDRLSYDILLSDLKRDIEGERFPGELTPIDQFNNFGNFFAQMGSGKSVQPFATVEDYDNFLKRAEKFYPNAELAVQRMREGIEAGVTNPKILMEKTLPQFKAHMVEKVEDSVYYMPIKNMPEDFPEEDKNRLTEAYSKMIAEQLVPAYTLLHDFIRDEYIPAGRESFGMLDLPDGKAWYNYMIKVHTSTDLTAEEIHQYGMDEVKRLRSEMEKVKEEVGFEGDLQAFFQHLKTSDEFYYKTPEEILQAYRDIRAKVNEGIGNVFDIFPKADYEVREIEAYRAKSSAAAMYMGPSPDGSRPGVFYVNTSDMKIQPKYGMETLSIHEASPGHHFQVSIKQETESLPAFRRFGFSTAYGEGWALYAESLGKEMGMYNDPYQYFGHLDAQMLRAMRLVVDTGLHYFGWTREQAIAFMSENSSMAEADVVAEVERYMAMPGQALAYKIGQRTIRDLRTEAEQELGERFDIKAFHRAVLVDGALPMNVLQIKIREWIAEQKQA